MSPHNKNCPVREGYPAESCECGPAPEPRAARKIGTFRKEAEEIITFVMAEHDGKISYIERWLEWAYFQGRASAPPAAEPLTIEDELELMAITGPHEREARGEPCGNSIVSGVSSIPGPCKLPAGHSGLCSLRAGAGAEQIAERLLKYSANSFNAARQAQQEKG